MSDPDKTAPQGSLRRVTLIASAAAAAIVAVLLGAIVAFQGSDNVLSPQDVAQRLAADSSSSPDDNPANDDRSPSPAAAPSTDPSAAALPGGGTAAGTPFVMDTVAATITLTCDGLRITAATWVIKPDYRLDDRSQTADYVLLKIESDVHDDVLVKAMCPQKISVTTEVDDHGGSGGGGKGKN
jgi:hypothetical protein